MIIRDVVLRMFSRWALALILLAAMGLPAPVEAANGMPRYAVRGDLSMRVVRVLPDKGVISAHEPVIVEVEVTNISDELVEVYYSGDLSTRIEVRDHRGKVVGDSPVYSYAEVGSSIRRLTPGQIMQSSFVPSAVYQFRRPGDYSVKIILLGEPGKITEKPSDLGPVLAETTVHVSVRPFDGKRLRARCNELIEPRTLHPSALPQFPPQGNMMALWSVRHNAALPALKFVTKYWGEFSYAWPTAVAIVRIGTPESAALLKALESRTDRMGRVVRSAETAGLRINSDDYFAGWTNVKSPEATVNEFLYYFRHRQWASAERFFSDEFRLKHASELKEGLLFASMAGGSVQPILDDPGSKALRSRREGTFTIVDVGQEAGDGAGQAGIAHIRLIGNYEWHLSDFPGSGSR